MRMRARELLAIMILLGGNASDARADAPTQAQAQRLASAGEPDQALAVLDAILAQKPNNPAALQLRARVLLDSRGWGDALAAYEHYLKVAPAGANRRAAEKIVANLEPVRTTVLEVTITDPANGPAHVYLDSKSLGVFCDAAPTCKQNVLPGEHRLIFEREGYEKMSAPVTFVRGKTLHVDRTLKAKASAVTITSLPAGALISLDGKPRGVAPQTVNLPPGDHEAVLALDGYLPATAKVTVRAGTAISTQLTLGRGVPVHDAVPGLSAQLDGAAVQLTDGKLAIPADGKAHQVVLAAADHRPATIEVPAQLGKDFAIDGQLLPDKIRLHFDGAMAGSVLVIDGKRVGRLPLQEAWVGEAGDHRVEITADGLPAYAHSGTFAQDQRVHVQVKQQHRRSKLWVVTGVAAAATVSGAVFGYLALDKQTKYDDLAKMPGASVSDPNLHGLQTRGDLYSVVSDASFGVALVGAGVATYWLVTGEKASPGAISVSFTPVGPNGTPGAGVGGHF